MQFVRAEKRQAKGRMALIGPSGSGKTYTALAVAQHLGARVAVIDTEHGSASKYADLFSFDVLELGSFAPTTFVDAIHSAEAAGYDIIVIDSLSHAWMGKDGALEQVDRAAKRSQAGNTFQAWRDVTPGHNAMVEALITSKAHIIVTLRAKTEYILEANEKGKMVPRKIGIQPVQRDGLEYEFDVTCDLTLDNELFVSKTRCSALKDKSYLRAGKDIAGVFRGWLDGGGPVPAAAPSASRLVEPPVASAPSEEQATADFLAQIAVVGTVGDLCAVGRRIAESPLSSTARLKLSPVYNQRGRELVGAAKGAA